MYFYKKSIMKKNIILLLLSFWFLPVHSQYTNVPDSIFEQELIDQGIDTNPTIDHQVLTSNIDNLITLVIEKDNIISFEGLQNFINLETLNIIGFNPAPTLNLENNFLLKNLILNGFGNILSLDLTNNVHLETIDISSNSLTNLNIDACINLKELYLYYCPITYIDLSNNLNLGKLSLAGLSFASLNINNNVALKRIALLNMQFTAIDFSNNINLEDLLLRNIPFTSLDFSNNINLKMITLRNLGGPITIFNSLLFSNNINLKKLIVDNVSFYPTVNLQNNLQLETCILRSTGLYYLDLLNNNSLKNLRIEFNFFTAINIQNLNQLQIFGCSYNNISSLNFDNKPFLEVLYCDNNNLQNLSIQNGANSLLNGTISGTPTNDKFIATNNPNLRCIYVDDVSNCSSNWLSKDAASFYVSTTQECNLLSTTTNLNIKFTLSPNPVDNFLNISTSIDLEIYSIKIYTIDGKLIQVSYNNFEQLDLSNLVAGIFTIEINTNSGKYFKKLLKK